MNQVNPDFAAEPLTERLAAYLDTGAETQSAFAQRCGIQQATLSRWLRGRRALNPEQLLAIHAALAADEPPDDERRSPEAPAEPRTSWPADRLADVVHALHTGQDPDGGPGHPAPVPATLTHAEIRPSPLNPRKTFDEAPIAQLADSIATQGLLQNLVVRRAGDRWILVAGERRWRAIGRLIEEERWAEDAPIPVRVVDVDDAGHRILALLENVQRVEVAPLEEARAFAELRDLGVSTDEIAERISRSRRHVQLRLRLLDLAPEAQAQLSTGAITLAVARVVAGLPAAEQVRRLKQADDCNWSAEQLAADVRRTWTKVELAAFPLENCGLEIVEEDGQRWFTDRAGFKAAQAAEAERRAEAFRADGWSFVRIENYHRSWEYLDGRSTDRSQAGVELELTHAGGLTERIGLVLKTDTEETGAYEATLQLRHEARQRNHQRLEEAEKAAAAAFRDAGPNLVLAAVLAQSLRADYSDTVGCAALDGFRDPEASDDEDAAPFPTFEAIVPGLGKAAEGGTESLLLLLHALPVPALLRLLAAGAAGCDVAAPGGRALAGLLGVALPELEDVP